MKKIIILLVLCAAFYFGAYAQSDTIILKNGKSVAGYIFKMNSGCIFLASGKDTSKYTTAEVQGIMFCHSVRGSGSSYSNSSSSYSSNPCNEKDAEKGKVIFKCNMCGGTGMLEIKEKNSNNKVIDRCRVALANGESFFEHVASLYPGEYTWNYSDDNKNEAKGSFKINKGQEKKIVLFENE